MEKRNNLTQSAQNELVYTAQIVVTVFLRMLKKSVEGKEVQFPCEIHERAIQYPVKGVCWEYKYMYMHQVSTQIDSSLTG